MKAIPLIVASVLPTRETVPSFRRIRETPPLLLVLTHVDRLRPFSEWQPPYDLNDRQSAKAISIRSAVDAAAADLGRALTEAGYELNDAEMEVVTQFRAALRDAGVDVFLKEQSLSDLRRMIKEMDADELSALANQFRGGGPDRAPRPTSRRSGCSK